MSSTDPEKPDLKPFKAITQDDFALGMQQFYSTDVVMSGDDTKDNRSTKVTFPQQDENMPLLVSYKIFN